MVLHDVETFESCQEITANPNDSVLIVTIDEKEYLHLGCLLEEMFPKQEFKWLQLKLLHKEIS